MLKCENMSLRQMSKQALMFHVTFSAKIIFLTQHAIYNYTVIHTKYEYILISSKHHILWIAISIKHHILLHFFSFRKGKSDSRVKTNPRKLNYWSIVRDPCPTKICPNESLLEIPFHLITSHESRYNRSTTLISYLLTYSTPNSLLITHLTSPCQNFSNLIMILPTTQNGPIFQIIYLNISM